MNDRLQALTDSGVSVWLDDISRARLTSGNLTKLIDERSVVGVTSNPTIFAKALSEADDYTDQVKDLAVRGVDLEEAVPALSIPHCETVRVDGVRQWIRFRRADVSAASVVSSIAAVAKVRDLAIEEPDIEDVVTRINTESP